MGFAILSAAPSCAKPSFFCASGTDLSALSAAISFLICSAGSVNFLVCGSMPDMIIVIFVDTSSYWARLGKPGTNAMQFIKLDLSNAIASIKLQHAGGNRINFQMREEIFHAVESVAKSDARVLVIKGDGEDFCLGGDVRDWPDVPVDKLRPRVEVFANALDRLGQLDIPTIASVQGGCAGGGFELALACDMIIASRSARFSFPEALIGIMTL